MTLFDRLTVANMAVNRGIYLVGVAIGVLALAAGTTAFAGTAFYTDPGAFASAAGNVTTISFSYPELFVGGDDMGYGNSLTLDGILFFGAGSQIGVLTPYLAETSPAVDLDIVLPPNTSAIAFDYLAADGVVGVIPGGSASLVSSGGSSPEFIGITSDVPMSSLYLYGAYGVEISNFTFGVASPEPSTWTMLAVGVVMLAVAALGQRRVPSLGSRHSRGDLRSQPRKRTAAHLATIAALPICLAIAASARAAAPTLGIIGDSISAGDGSGLGENPNWVAQLTGSGSFVVPPNANQAAWGATASNVPFFPGDNDNIASQLPAIQAIAANFDYVALIIGGNDFVALLDGDESVATFNSTVVSQIETTLNGLPSSDHEIVATIPDIAVTPAIQSEFSQAAIAAAEPIVQAANAQIISFAEARDIPVLDLYSVTHNVIGVPSQGSTLTLAGVNYTSTSTTDPLFSTVDQFHPAPILQGLLADMAINAADRGYGAGLAPLSEQQLVTNAGQTPLVSGLTNYDVSPYVIVPEPASLLIALIGLGCIAAAKLTAR